MKARRGGRFWRRRRQDFSSQRAADTAQGAMTARIATLRTRAGGFARRRVAGSAASFEQGLTAAGAMGAERPIELHHEAAADDAARREEQ
jgi:hypothetical protein